MPLMAQIRRRLTPQPIRFRADVDVTCFTEEGIEAVKKALLAGQAASTEDVPVKIQLIAPPSYVILAVATSKKTGLEVVTKAVDLIGEKISELGGKLVVQLAPQATSAQDEDELEKKLKKLELENREVDGDDDQDSE